VHTTTYTSIIITLVAFALASKNNRSGMKGGNITEKKHTQQRKE